MTSVLWFSALLSFEDKPENPKSNFAITGLYFYPSGRDRLEITFRNGWISKQELLESAEKNDKSHYCNRLRTVAKGRLKI